MNNSNNVPIISQDELIKIKYEEKARIFTFYDINLSLDDAKNYLNYYLSSPGNSSIIDITDYELIFTIEFLFNADEEIKNLLEQVKYKISNEYIKKKRYLIRLENMPE